MRANLLLRGRAARTGDRLRLPGRAARDGLDLPGRAACDGFDLPGRGAGADVLVPGRAARDGLDLPRGAAGSGCRVTDPSQPLVGFKRHLSTAVVPGDAVYVLSEEGA